MAAGPTVAAVQPEIVALAAAPTLEPEVPAGVPTPEPGTAPTSEPVVVQPEVSMLAAPRPKAAGACVVVQPKVSMPEAAAWAVQQPKEVVRAAFCSTGVGGAKRNRIIKAFNKKKRKAKSSMRLITSIYNYNDFSFLLAF